MKAAPDPEPGRVRLDRERVARAAVALIDEQGVHALSMRRLARRLGVEAMSLYGHVDGREGLLDAIIGAVIDDLYEDPETHLRDTDSWQDYLVRVAHGVRRCALAHPNVFPLVASQPPEAPWIRPPLRSLSWVESFLKSLRSQGFTDDAAVYTYRAFTSFLLGHLLLEVAALGAQIAPLPTGQPDHLDARRLSEFPTVTALRAKLSQNAADDEFDESLDNLISRVATVYTHGSSD